MLNVKELSLDLGKRTSNQHVIIAQGDTNGTTIEATIYDHGTKLADTGLTAYFVMLLPDGEHYVRDAAEYDTGVITYTVNEAYAAAVTGYTPVAYFELHDGRDTLVATTERFSVTIEQCAYDGLEPAESWDSEIAQLIIDGTLAVNAVEDALETLVDQEQSMLTGATATVDATTGTPSVTITMGEPQEGGRSANFAFGGIKGETGATGAQGEKGDKGDKGDDYVITAADYAAIAQQVESDIQPTIDAAQDAADDATAAAAEARAASSATWLSGNVLFGELEEAAVLTTDDAYAAPPKGVEVYGVSTQDGTPTPDVPVPILSVDDLTLHVCGLNIWDEQWELGGFAAINGVPWRTTDRIRCKNAISVIPNTTYRIEAFNAAATISALFNLYYYGIGGTYIGTVNVMNQHGGSQLSNFTIPANVHYMRFATQPTYGTTYNNDICINVSDTSSDGTYAPYVGQSIPIPLSDHIARSLPDGTRDTLTLSYVGPSTREGWGVFSKTLVQRIGEYDAATLAANRNWNYDNNGVFYVANWNVSPNLLNLPTGKVGNVYCNILKAASWNDWLSEEWQVTQTAYLRLNVDTSVTGTTVDAFKTWLAASGLVFCVELREPITHDLGTVELPVNPALNLTAWADGGSAQPTLAMEYERDVNIALVMERDKAMAEIAPLETSPTKANHSVGTYLMYGGTLYKVTRAIASGEQITPGTNVTATTVAAELLALA